MPDQFEHLDRVKRLEQENYELKGIIELFEGMNDVKTKMIHQLELENDELRNRVRELEGC